MLFLEYEEYKSSYLETQRIFDSILREKEELYQRTQPQGTDYTKDKINTSNTGNAFESYIIAKDKRQIDQRLDEVRGILDDRERLLKLKLAELRASEVIEDRVYRMRFLDRWKIKRIALMTNYSEPQIYRILKFIHIALHDDSN